MARVAGVSIDSRTVRPGELFVAIHGPRHDGHSFVAAALVAGASAAMVARGRLGEYDAAIRQKLFAVENTLGALQGLAQSVRRGWGKRVAGVTGSTGKTTTKEILAAVAGAGRRVVRSEGNLNNEYGVPLTLLRLEEEDEAAVVELGMSHRGEIARLCEISEPELGVVTNVAPVHLEFFGSVEEIAEAKRELVEGLAGPEPVAVLNADDERVARFGEKFRGRVLTFGLKNQAAAYRAENVALNGAEGAEFDYVAPGERVRMKLALPGRHNVSNALAALAAASAWGVRAEEARAPLASVAPAAMRGQFTKFAAGFAVINDCYNSNPVALARMAELLAATPARRRILAAGAMLELGAKSGELHRAAGRHAAGQKPDFIFGVSGDAKELLAGAIEAGHPAAKTRFFETSGEAGAALAEFVREGDVLLVKGSRGVKMEKIIEALEARHGTAAQANGAGRG